MEEVGWVMANREEWMKVNWGGDGWLEVYEVGFEDISIMSFSSRVSSILTKVNMH